MSSGDKIVLLDDPHIDWSGAVQFRLTYEGELLAEANRGRLQPLRAKGKHEIRKVFHRQLKRCWEVMPQLNGGVGTPGIINWTNNAHQPRNPTTLAANHPLGDYNFVPLVTRDLVVLCGLDILLLRPDTPESRLTSGDIDNRLKTLFDALTKPTQLDQLGGYLAPDDDERPFFCLLSDDRLISRVAVETDTMLEPINGAYSLNDARVVITVNLIPNGFDVSERYLSR